VEPLGIKYEDLAYTSSNGFAAVGANNGKNGTGGLPFYKHPEVVIDFAWRSSVLQSSNTVVFGRAD
jgi:feruloyl esterase